ncbi:MAG: helix-turn-helix transcriptional regulator [Devosia sp.]
MEVILSLGRKAKLLRLARDLTQEGLANRANVSLGTLKLFERTGKASLETTVRIAFALGAEREFDSLFPHQQISRIEDVIEAAPRKRGRKK